MQLQIECNPVPFQKQLCLTCEQLFEMAEAKVIACNDQGKSYGEVCPHCLKQGFDWLSDRFDHLRHRQTLSQPLEVIHSTRAGRLPVSA